MPDESWDGGSSGTQKARDERIFEVILQEKQFLREELRHLKDCQLRYVVLAVGGTGAFFALVATAVIGDTARQHHWLTSVIFLTPLVFVIPCARIFFDKARTISRLVGYFRLLEAWSHTHRQNADRLYIGWERALSRWRAEEKSAIAENGQERQARRDRALPQVYLRRIRFGVCHEIKGKQYWFIIYNIFFWMSVIILSVQTGNTLLLAYDDGPFEMKVIFAIFILLAAIYISIVQFGKIGGILYELAQKGKTYDDNEKRWREIHLGDRPHQ